MPIAARRTPEEFAEVLAAFAKKPELRRIVAVFDVNWPESYRALFRSAIQDAFAGRVTGVEQIGSADVFRLGRGE